MIHGVETKKLKLHSDDRGRLMELLRADDALYERFGQVYMTTCLPGHAKAWHLHKKQIDNFVCVKGKIRLGLYDARENSPTRGKVQEFFLDMESETLVKIPAGVYHGFECATGEEAIVINISSDTYNREFPDEFRKPFDDPEIPFKWKSNTGG